MRDYIYYLLLFTCRENIAKEIFPSRSLEFGTSQVEKSLLVASWIQDIFCHNILFC